MTHETAPAQNLQAELDLRTEMNSKFEALHCKCDRLQQQVDQLTQEVTKGNKRTTGHRQQFHQPFASQLGQAEEENARLKQKLQEASVDHSMLKMRLKDLSDENKRLKKETLEKTLKKKESGQSEGYADLEKKLENSQQKENILKETLQICQWENRRLKERLEQIKDVEEKEDTEQADAEREDVEEGTVLTEPISRQALAKIECIMRFFIEPLDLIPVLLHINVNLLTVPEKEQIHQDCLNYGRSRGASTLLDRIRRHEGWLEGLIKTLSHPDIKMAHVAQTVGEKAGLDSKTLAEWMREGESPYDQETGDQRRVEETLPKTMADCTEAAAIQDGENKDQAEKIRLQEEIDRLKTKLQEIQDLREKDFKRVLDNLDSASGRAELAAEKTQQSQVGFEARAPADLCLSVTRDQRLRCLTEVVGENPGGHYHPSDCTYRIPQTGRYRVSLTHSQREEDRKGGIWLGVWRAWREAGSGEWKKCWLGPRCETVTNGRECEGISKGERLSDSFVLETQLDEGERLWVRVAAVDFGAKLIFPCYFSCRLLS